MPATLHDRRAVALSGGPLAAGALLTVALLTACGSGEAGTWAFPDAASIAAYAEPTLSPAAFLAHVGALADDSMLGRGTGQRGGAMAAAYLAGAFREAGLEAPGDAPGFRQTVPLIAARVVPGTVEAVLFESTRSHRLDPAELDIAAPLESEHWSERAPVVLAGYGVYAPGTGHDDYARLDARGAFVAVLPGAPPRLTGRLAGGGGAYEISREGKSLAARRHGAVGILFLTPPGSEDGFRASVRRNMGFAVLAPGWRPSPESPVSATLGPSSTGRLLAAAGTTWEAFADEPTPTDPGIDLSLSFSLASRRFRAPNLVGVVPGTAEETVVVSAHYDAYGVGPPDAEGDSIYNGATDNASGTAALLELARDLTSRPEPPRRTVVFLATTAEEGGALGARYWLDHRAGARGPVVVNVNLDGVGFSPPTDDFAVFPSVGTDLVPALADAARPLGMRHGPQPWHDGMHFSFDTKEFLARGIVGLTVWQGFAVREPVEGRGGGGTPIHTPNDELGGTWSAEGITQHLRLYRRIVERYADGAEPPSFVEGHPFAALTLARAPDR